MGKAPAEMNKIIINYHLFIISNLLSLRE